MTMNKVMALADAMAPVKPGISLMVGEFVGMGEPARCIEHIVEHGIGELTLIANTVGLRGSTPLAKLFSADLVRELIGSHAATSTESSEAYLSGRMKVAQFFPMGTWAEKVRAGGVGLGGVLVPVGVGILDAPGVFPDIDAKRTIELAGKTFFVEEALRADVAIIKGYRADRLGNVEFRYTSTQNQRDLAMAGRYTIAEVNEIVEVGEIPPERVGCPGPFVNAVVQGYTLEEQHDAYRDLWIRLGRLPPLEDAP